MKYNGGNGRKMPLSGPRVEKTRKEKWKYRHFRLESGADYEKRTDI